MAIAIRFAGGWHATMAAVRRTTCVIWLGLATGCYTPELPEGRACSETDRCPTGQSCDPALRVCASFAPCATPAVSDAFDDGERCVPWGHAYGNATVTEMDGALEVTPSSAGANDGGCEGDGDLAFADGGLFVEVAPPLAPGHGYTGFRLYFAASPSPDLGVSDGVLTLAVYGGQVIAEVPFDPSEMSWWRIRPDRRVGAVVAEYSGDGSHWSMLGALPGEPPPTMRIALFAGTTTTDPTPGTARFRNLGLCPPGSSL
jgi:hypothetical protein